jgi:hypothetical protein
VVYCEYGNEPTGCLKLGNSMTISIVVSILRTVLNGYVCFCFFPLCSDVFQTPDICAAILRPVFSLYDYSNNIGGIYIAEVGLKLLVLSIKCIFFPPFYVICFMVHFVHFFCI